MVLDPNTTIDDAGDASYTADYQDQQDQYERQQAGLTPAPAPSALRQTAPGVYSPTPAPAAPAAPAPRTGITRKPRFNPMDYEVNKDAPGLQFRPETVEEHPGWWHDMGQAIWQGTLSQGKDVVDAAQFAAQQMGADPTIKQHIKDASEAVDGEIKSSIASMSPERQKALSASWMSMFNGDNVDANGVKIPSPGEVGYFNYFSTNIAQLVPTVLTAILPASLVGKMGIKALSMLGMATKATDAVTGAVTATRAANIARTGIQAGTTGSIFGAEGTGQMFDFVQKQLADMKPEQKMNSPIYAEIINRGGTDADGSEAMLRASAPYIYGYGALSGIAGVGVGGIVAGKLGAAGLGRVASAALGGAEGAVTMGAQGAGEAATQQAIQNQQGQRQGYDFNAILANAVSQGTPGLVLGAGFGALHGRHAEPAKPPQGDTDPANVAALAAADIYGTPAGPPEIAGPPAPPQGQLDLGTAPPGPPRGGAQGEMFPTVQEANAPTNVAPPLTGAPAPTPPPGPADQQAGMVGAKQGELPINQAPPTMVAATGQGEMFPSLPEANPPVAQVTPFRGDQPPPPPPPGAPPPGGGGGTPAATQAAVKTSQAKAPPAPTGERPSGTMKKAELNDALVGMGIDTKGMNRDDMARRFDREQARAPSTPTPDVSTVVKGPPTAPARETVPGPGAETQAAPPTQGALTPPTSEGVRETPPTTEPTFLDKTWLQEAGAQDGGYSMRKGGEALTDVGKQALDAGHKVELVTDGGKKTVEITQTKNGMLADAQGQTWGSMSIATDRTGKEGLRITPAKPEPKAEISTGVRPEGGAPPATDERPAGATAEVTPDVKPKEDPRETAIGHLAAAKQRVLAEATAGGAPVRKGSIAEKAIDAAMAEMQRAFNDPKQNPDDVMKLMHTEARRGTPNEGETIANYMARRRLVTGMLKEMTGNENIKLPALKLKKVADTRSEIEQVRAEEQQRGAEEATRKATTSEATEEKATGASETGETTGAEAVDEKLPKGTSIVVRAKKLVQQILDPQHAMDVPTAEKILAKTSNLGRPRTTGFGDLHAAFETEWKRITGEAGQKIKAKLEAELARLDRQQPMTEEGTQGRVLEEQQHDRAVAKVQKQLEEYAPERLIAMAKAMKEIADPIKDAADKKDALLARIAEKKGEAQPLRHEVPAVTGISPRSSRLVKVATDQRMSASLIRAMRASEQHGVEFTDRDLARLVMQDPLISSEMPGLKAMAAQLFKLARDVPILTPQRAFERGLIDHEELEYSQKPGSYGSYYSEPGKEHIWVNLDQSHEHGTHVETAVHELVHSAFSHHIDYLERFDPNHRDLQALRAMREELLDHAQDAFEAGDLSKRELENLSYALSNEQEFHTMMLTNPDVQAFAASRTASDTFRSKIARLGFGLREGGRSVWSHFVDVVRKSLGFREPASASEYTLFDHFMRPVTAIAEHATRYNERYLPHDPMLRAQAAPLYHGLTQAFGDRARTAIDHIDPKGLSAKGLRAVLQSAPLDRIVERYGHLSEHIGKTRDALDKATVAGSRFLRQYSDKAVMLSNQLRGKDDVANLMNDAGYAKAVLGSKDPDANAHLTTPEQRARLAELETQFSRLPTADQELYRRVVDFGNEKYARVRAASGERLLNDLLPHGTDAERDVLRTAMRTKASMEAYLVNPDNPAIDASRRVIAKGIVSLHRDGFVQGDYFPMRRYGDYIVEYGEHGTPSYGMQAFEKRSDADAFRRDALTRGMDPQEVRERDSIVQNHTMRTSPVVQDMLDRINVTPELRPHAEELRNLVTRLQMQYVSAGERARARRQYVAGASKDIGRALQTDTAAQGMQIGRYEHGAEIRNMMEQIKHDRDALARNGGDAFTLDQVHHELQRQIETGDTATWSGASGVTRKATSFGFAHSLASFSRIAVETAELHLKMAAFIGARHGPLRASLELTRALKDISPRLWAKGMTNTAKAFIGKPLSAVDYQLSEMARQRLLEAGHNTADVNAFFEHFEDNGLFDQTRAQSLKELARSTTTGKAFNWFMEVSSAMSHASEESNRIAGTWAAFRADRSKGASVTNAIKFAEDVLRKAPNFAPHNKPRIATERGALGKFGAPIMQFKMYGFNEYWMLANLARDIVSRNTDPVKRKEAIAGLTGVLMTHAMMAGVLTWYADPARYIGGAWDILTGQKPHDHSLAARKWLSDSIGPTWAEILGRGLPHAIGWDLHTRSGAENMLNVPTMSDWTPKDFALFMGQAAMGASGSDAANVISGISHMLHGEWLQGGKEILPRILRDPLKAYDLYDRGLVDVRGKPILARDKISGWNIASQALGFVPANVADAREARQAIQETEQAQNDQKTRLTQKWVQADPADRSAIWAQIEDYNRQPDNATARITRAQLLQLANQRRKVAAQPGAFGLQLPKNRAKELMKAGSFASNVQ